MPNRHTWISARTKFVSVFKTYQMRARHQWIFQNTIKNWSSKFDEIFKKKHRIYEIIKLRQLWCQSHNPKANFLPQWNFFAWFTFNQFISFGLCRVTNLIKNFVCDVQCAEIPSWARLDIHFDYWARLHRELQGFQ